MSTDLVARLREASNESYNSTAELFDLLGEAAKEIERLRQPVRSLVYSPCSKHMGQAFTMWVGPSAEPIVKCPICEPPERPA